MQTLKRIILISIILSGLLFVFGPEVLPENFQPQEVLDLAKNSDIIIIFNSGGWGNTPFEKAKDFAPIVEGMQKTLEEWGYRSVVIPFNRTKNSFLGEITGAKEFFTSFHSSAENLANEIEILAEKSPDKKIIITGLSNGAAFVSKTYEKISKDFKDSVYIIAVGTPFWTKTEKGENVLQVNSINDSLAMGNIKSLFLSFLKGPLNWLSFKITGKEIPFVQAFIAKGHIYLWSSPEINSQITSFLENKLR